MFVDQVEKLCRKKGISITQLVQEVGLGKATKERVLEHLHLCAGVGVRGDHKDTGSLVGKRKSPRSGNS